MQSRAASTCQIITYRYAPPTSFNQTKVHLAGSIVCRLCVYDGITLSSGDCSINCQQLIVQSGPCPRTVATIVTAADLLSGETGNSCLGLQAALTLEVD